MKQLKLIIAALLLISPFSANAELIPNGTFDSDLSNWGEIGNNTWVGGTAHIGRPGTPGVSGLVKSLDIPTGTGTTAVSLSFDYEWQVNPPTLEDLFQVFFLVDDGGSEASFISVIYQWSGEASFGTTVSFADTLMFPDLEPASGDVLGNFRNAVLVFRLTENNEDIGTRIQLDNVSLQVLSVPEPGTLALLGLGLVGVGMTRRKKNV